ncbi:MAG TPA: HAMP domain-containing sensor histidine kinase [Sphaerochaeta sp.]|jgi:two-component system sensor histidine kinase HydH|nr:HAMP domain-containing sensor histidine kinase [Sphaerochaeta sp.]HOQ95122.1 HAMP domain-containing sensor histidine kinase [Sphaerochaeta sp.]HPK47805.1 HAMP domain-containing sensor histidine kinase [Sphaerochaeta sp.]
MIGDAREPYIVITSLAVAFLLLVSLVIFLTTALIEREQLRMQSEAERAFNSVFLALQDSTNKAQKTMAEENVSGIGVYSSMGRRVLSLGNVPMTIPLDRFSSSMELINKSNPNTGVATYNRATKMIEYIRFSRLTILLDTGQLTLTESGLLPTPIDFPDVLYLIFDGEEYHQRLVIIGAIGISSSLVLIGLFLLVLNIYRSNRRYRETIAKQESLVNLGQAARTLTHEIKNPLSAITIQLALLKKTLPSEYDTDLIVIDQELNRLTQLTNKVSDFLRNPLGNPVQVDLNELLLSLIKCFDKPIAFSSEKHYTITFDEDRARSVFENLLKNAVESAGEGDPQVEVKITSGKRNLLHVFIMDRGEGIPPTELRKIFDPFFTTKIHGSGIGLSISRQFVKARGGNLRLYRREGGGTVAEVTLSRSIHPVKKGAKETP